MGGIKRGESNDEVLEPVKPVAGPQLVALGDPAPELPLFPLEDFPRAKLGAVAYLKVERLLFSEGGDEPSDVISMPEKLSPSADEETIFERWGGGVYRVRARDAAHRTIATRDGREALKIEGAPKSYGRVATSQSMPAAAVQNVAPGVLAPVGLNPEVQAILTMSQQQVEATRNDSKQLADYLLRALELAGKSTPAVPVDPTGSAEAMREMRSMMSDTRKQLVEMADENLKLRRQLATGSRTKPADESDDFDVATYAMRALVDAAAPFVAKEISPQLVPIARRAIAAMPGGGGGGGVVGGESS